MGKLHSLGDIETVKFGMRLKGKKRRLLKQARTRKVTKLASYKHATSHDVTHLSLPLSFAGTIIGEIRSEISRVLL